jgi:hypothetical protein
MAVFEDDDFDESLLLAVDQWESDYIARSSGVTNAHDASSANNSVRGAQNQSSWAAPVHQSVSLPEENFLGAQPHTHSFRSVSAERSYFVAGSLVIV